MNKIKYIAVIALDNRKTDLIEWSYFNRNILTQHKILALGIAANILDGTLNIKVNRPQTGKLGEYRELINLMNNEQIDGVVIFADAEQLLNGKELSHVLETAISNNIIITTNRTSADFILHSSLLNEDYTIQGDEKKAVDNPLLINAKAA